MAGAWRGQIKQRIRSMAGRRRFWEKVLNGRFASLVAQGRLELSWLSMPTPEHGGKVALVGTGPGDSGLAGY